MIKHLGWALIALTLLGSGKLMADAPPDSTPGAKLPVPDADALRAATTAIGSLYSVDEINAKSPAENSTFAKKLLDTADNEKDPANRYELYLKARAVATDAGDSITAFAAIDKLDAGYEIDAPKMKAVAAGQLVRLMQWSGERRILVQLILEAASQAGAAGEAAAVNSLCAAASSAAQPLNDSTLSAQIAAVSRQQRSLSLEYAKIKPDFLVLYDNPANPDANLKVGRFRCFIAGDWAHGLPNLAQGSDPDLQTLAKLDLAGASGDDPDAVSTQQIAIADGWFDLAGKEPAQAAGKFNSGRGNGIRAFSAAASGLAKTKAQKRLDELKLSLTGGVPEEHSVEIVNIMTAGMKPPTPTEGVLVLTDFTHLRSADSYTPPVMFTILTQTDSTNIRIGYAANQIIFDWEEDKNQLRVDGGPANGRHKKGAGFIPPNQWAEIELIVQPTIMIIQVNGVERYRTQADFSAVNEPISIFPSNRATLLVKSVVVTTAQ